MKVNNNCYLKIVLLIIVALIALSGCGSSDSQQAASGDKQEVGDVVTLTLSYPQPESSFYGDTYGYFAKAIEEESGGSIKVNVYPAATLVGDNEIFDAISQGNVDMGHFFSTYVSPLIPDLLPFEVPGAYPGDRYEELNNATFETVDRIFSKAGVKFIALSYPDTIAFSSNKKLIKKPEDLKGLTVRSSGKWPGEAIKIWGGAPATIPIGEVAVALERGTVDVCYTSWMMTDSYKFYESAPHVTFTDLQNSYYGIIMNGNRWASLKPEQQEAIKRAADRFRAYSQEVYTNLKDKFVETLTKMGAEVYTLNEEENRAFREPSLRLMEEVKKLIGEDGLALIEAMESMYR